MTWCGYRSPTFTALQRAPNARLSIQIGVYCDIRVDVPQNIYTNAVLALGRGSYRELRRFVGCRNIESILQEFRFIQFEPEARPGGQC